MNIFEHLTERAASERSNLETEPCLIVPGEDALPQDGVLDYVTFDGLKGLIDVVRSAKTVIVFRGDQLELLEILTKYPKHFGFHAVVLAGAPGVNYTPEFEAATYSLHRAAYHAVINDAAELERRSVELTAEKKASSQYEKEASTYVRKTGNVKEFTAFDVPTGTGLPTQEPDYDDTGAS